MIYWQGEPIKRDSKEYDELVTELYVSAIQNYFYRNALKNCKLPIIHAIGENDKEKTVYTRYEFEEMLNCLREYLAERKYRCFFANSSTPYYEYRRINGESNEFTTTTTTIK